MKKRLLLLSMFLGFLSTGFSQTIGILNKKFVVNGNASCPIYFNGANTPWNNWNDFGGNYSSSFWSTHFATLKANGINASRVWISCNGDVQPNINTDGTVTGVSAQFWANLDDFFASAQSNGIYIMATMMSFDHTKNTYNKFQSWRNMLNDQTKVQSYCDNYLVPFVNRYKTNPYLMSIDISNEIEWVAEDAANMKCSYAVLQRFVAMCASSIHNNPRTDGSTVLVTLGSAATKWNGTKMRQGSNGAWSQNNSDGNKWSDAALKAQYNQPNATLDYYSPHYYSWIDEWYSNPFVRSPTDFGIDEKPVVIGETPAGNPGTPNLSVLASYEALKNNGYQGHFPWTSNGVDALGDISKFGTDAKTFATTYSALVKPVCSVACTTVAPTVTTPVVYCKSASSTALTATGTALKWYADNTTTTALSAAPVPSTSSVGTINYYVSQTLNGCEGPRSKIAVTIKDLPTATVTTTSSTTFCTGGNVLLSANTGNGFSYVWNKDATPLSGATTATYSATASGSYTVTVSSNGCSATSVAKVVTVNILPAATISTTSSTTFCTGGNVLLSANTGNGFSYVWNKDATPLSGATTATYSATTSGSYTVTVSSNGCSATSSAKVVTANPLPAATISTTTATTFCTGGSVLLSANTGNGFSYVWNKDATPISGATTATYSATASGSYTVTVSSNGCSATSAAKVVTVNILPTATITATTATTFCTGGSVLLSANTGNGFSYVWNKDATPISGATTSTYSANASGSYSATVSSNGCSATSAAKLVTVSTSFTWYRDVDGDGKGDATVSQTSCTQPIGYVSISGDLCPLDVNKFAPGSCGCGNSEIDTDQDLMPDCIDTDDDNDGVLDGVDCNPLNASIGTKTVWYQDLDGDGKGDASVSQTSCTQPTGYVSEFGDACPTDATKLSPGLCGCGVAEGTCPTTGIVDLKSTDAIKIMPNPSTEQFNLVLTKSAMVYISSIDGKLVETFSNVTDLTFGSDYAKGVYVVQIMNGSTSQVVRVIKQ